jgi:hypothetical protein
MEKRTTKYIAKDFNPDIIKKTLTDNDTEYIIDLLKETSSILAGGSVLKSYSNYLPTDTDLRYNKTDYDIYTHSLQLPKILGVLRDNRYYINYIQLASSYQESFFMKNNILLRIILIGPIINLDLMVIRDTVPLENVIEHFDLTFCRIWFDGEYIHSHNPEDIKTMSGKLNEEYHKVYQENNPFIWDRIRKYMCRGFKIDLPTKKTEYEKLLRIRPFTQINTQEAIIKHLFKMMILELFEYDSFESNVAKEYVKMNKLVFNAINRIGLFEEALATNRDGYTDNYFESKAEDAVKALFACFYSQFNDYTLEEFERIFKLCGVVEYKRPLIAILKNIRKFVSKNTDKTVIKLLDFYGISLLNPYSFDKSVSLALLDEQLQNQIKTNLNPQFPKIDVKLKKNTIGFDIILFDEIKCIDWVKQSKNNLVFLMKSSNGTISDKIYVATKNTIDTLCSNKNDGWFYECQKNPQGQYTYVMDKPYIKLSIGPSLYFDYMDIFKILKSKIQIFIISQTDRNIPFTASFKNTHIRTSQYVGANHCQKGSNIVISKVEESTQVFPIITQKQSVRKLLKQNSIVRARNELNIQNSFKLSRKRVRSVNRSNKFFKKGHIIHKNRTVKPRLFNSRKSEPLRVTYKSVGTKI